MAFTRKQREFLDHANHRWNIKEGATRSGKTYLDYFVIPKRIRRVAGLPGLVVILGNTKGTLSRNIIEPLQDLYGPALVSDIRSDNTASLFGEKCYCLGADKVNQVNRIRGSSIKYCYGDEIATWHEDVFTMLKSRLDRPYSKFDGTLNPESPHHWFHKFLESDADIYRQSYTIDDNPTLDPGFVENLKREYAGTVYYDRYILGKWVVAQGLIYPMFREDRHVVDQLPEQGAWYISVDYGTLNPCSMGLWRWDGSRAVRAAEYYHSGRESGRQLTDEEYYSALEQLAGGRSVECVVVDPSAASFITCIRRHGRFRVRQAVNDVLNGIRLTTVLLQTGRLLFDRSCRDSIREFGLYRWDEAAPVDRPLKADDHAMDDIRYFCSTILRQEINPRPNYSR